MEGSPAAGFVLYVLLPFAGAAAAVWTLRARPPMWLRSAFVGAALVAIATVVRGLHRALASDDPWVRFGGVLEVAPAWGALWFLRSATPLAWRRWSAPLVWGALAGGAIGIAIVANLMATRGFLLMALLQPLYVVESAMWLTGVRVPQPRGMIGQLVGLAAGAAAGLAWRLLRRDTSRT